MAFELSTNLKKIKNAMKQFESIFKTKIEFHSNYL